MKNILITISFVVCFSLVMGLVAPSTGQATLRTIPQLNSLSLSTVTGTYANSQTDTVYFYRNPNLASLSLGIYTADSANLTSVVVRRVVNGRFTTVYAGDTLSTTDTTTAAANVLYSVTVNSATLPLSDLFAFVIVYAAAGNGVTTPNVTYSVNKTFYK